MTEPKVKHYGHDEGAWFWGCEACNPIDTDTGGQRIRRPESEGRVDWVCPECKAGMTSWHGTALKCCGHCGQSETPLLRTDA